MNATGASAQPPPSPVVPTVSAPTITGGVESAAVDHGSAESATGAPIASTGGGGAPMAAPMVGGGPVPAPMAPVGGAPATPAGPLPAYGSDLRPPVVAPPSLSAPTTPVSGAPAVASPSTSASAGSPLMSPVQRASVGQVGTSPAVPAGAAASSAASGAVAGDVSTRAVEQRRLQRLVDAVARQAPGLAWAAGLRDDGTTLLVSDIGCGWIPPNVKIPVGVNRLLEPALRRSGVSVTDLLGGVTTAAVHSPTNLLPSRDPTTPPSPVIAWPAAAPRWTSLAPRWSRPFAAVTGCRGLPKLWCKPLPAELGLPIMKSTCCTRSSTLRIRRRSRTLKTCHGSPTGCSWQLSKP